MKIVNSMILLKAMANYHHIVLDDDTGKTVKHWTGHKTKAYYVASGEREFKYKGKTYGVRYFDGCFKPFVVLLDGKETISFV